MTLAKLFTHTVYGYNIIHRPKCPVLHMYNVAKSHVQARENETSKQIVYNVKNNGVRNLYSAT